MNEKLAVLLVTAVAQQTQAIAALGANIMHAVDRIAAAADKADNDEVSLQLRLAVDTVPYKASDFEGLICEAGAVRCMAEQYKVGGGS